MKVKRIKSVILCFLGCALAGTLYCYVSVRRNIPVIAYHHIQDIAEGAVNGDNPYVVSVDIFEKHMKYLRDNNYHAITPEELIDYLYNGINLPRKSIFIQFDDGYYSNIALAYPVLRKYGLKATVFMITAETVTDQSRQDAFSYAYITESSMENTGDVFSFASHTHRLHELDGARTAFYLASEAEISDDLRESFKIARNHSVISYPHGQYNDNNIAAVKNAGVQAAFTTNKGYITKNSDPFKLRRFTVFNNTSFFGFVAYVRGLRYYPEVS